MYMTDQKSVTYASLLRRFAAYFVDGIIQSVIVFTLALVILVPLGILTGLSADPSMSADEINNGAAAFSLLTTLLVIIISLIAVIAYETLLTASNLKGTLGKALFSIQVVLDESGNKLTLGKSLVRTLVKYFSGSILTSLVYLVCLFTDKKQNLHDLVVKSVVLKK